MKKLWIFALLIVAGCVVMIGGRSNTVNILDRTSSDKETTLNEEVNNTKKSGVEINADTRVTKDVIMGENGKFDTVAMKIDTANIIKKKK